MAKSRGNTCRILRVFLKLFAVAFFLNLAEEPVCTAATTLDKTSTKCDSKEGAITCNRMDLTDGYALLLSDVKFVTNFSAAFNKLTRVPRVLQEASNLVTLNMSHNRFSFFYSSDFQEMSKLENLDLSFNQLTEVNLTGEVLSALKTLILSNNGLRTFNIDGARIKKLQFLNLNNNNLQNNLNFLQDLPKINHLFLDSNRISKIDRCVSGESYLKTLSLRDNQLTNVSFLNGCTFLHKLDLSKNNISVVNGSWTNKFTIISYLSIAYNSIENAGFLRNILVLQALQHLDISHNRIKHIDHSLIKAGNVSKKITCINVSYNELDDLSFVTKIKSIDTLNADYNNILSIADFPLPELTKLTLSNNNLSKLNFLANLLKLEILNLGSNMIDDIENNFHNLIELRSLDLSNNKLSHIEVSQNAPNFTFLNISGNKLKKLPCNSHLQSLYINENDISDLNIKCMPRLRTLFVFGTVIQNKYTIPLYEAKAISFQIPNHHAVECAPTKTAVMACSKACDISSLNEVFCSRVVNTTPSSIYIGLSAGLISLFMVLLLIRYRWRMKHAPIKICTCITRIEERRH